MITPRPGSTVARRLALRAEAERLAARAQAQGTAQGAAQAPHEGQARPHSAAPSQARGQQRSYAQRQQASQAQRQPGAAQAPAQQPVSRGPSVQDRYGSDVLTSNPHRVGPRAIRPESVRVPATPGMVLEDRQTGFVGALIRTEKSGGQHIMVLEDRHGVRRAFPLGPGFWLDGRPVVVDPPVAAPSAPTGPRSAAGRALTASGSYKVEGEKPRVARASRIWVEGRHDAELVEKVWGDDLRHEGVVVLMLDGVDNLMEVMRDFQPGPRRRAGVLVDHLVAGSKESRIAQEVTQCFGAENICILGHPYVDVWQAVKPARLGLQAWPEIPRGTDIKHGTLEALGWPHASQADIARGWQRILARVESYKDLEPALLGRMEELIDFVTAVEE